MRETLKLRRRDFIMFTATALAGILGAAASLRAETATQQADRPHCPARTRRAEPKPLDLSRIERRLLRLYYYEGLSPKEIGVVLGLSELQVSQVHSDILKRLRGFVNYRKP